MSAVSSRRARVATLGRSRSGRRWWALGALGLALLVVGLDTTVVVTALPTLSAKLGASTGALQWVMNAYTLVLAGLILPAGVLGDRLGRRRVLLGGLAVFGVSSLVASQTSSAGGLIALRAVMGVGAAAIVPLAFSILPSLFSEDERPRAISVLAATVFLGLPLGPLIAGFLLERYSWGSIFLINVPVVALALAGVWRLVPDSKDERAPRLDLLGALLAVTAVTALVYGIVEQPTRGWGAAPVLAGLGAGAVLLTAFVVWELLTRSPLVDLNLFWSARFSWATVAFVVVGFAIGGVLFILTPFLQLVQGNDAQQTGIRLLPMIGGIVAGAAPSDRLSARLGTKAMVAAGLLTSAAGALLLSGVGADAAFAQTAVAEGVIGLGIGLAMPTALDAILGELPEAEAGMGMALTRTMQFVAMSLGVAVLGSVLNGAYRAGLVGHLTGVPASAQTIAKGSIAAAQSLPPHVFAAARVAYANGMGHVMVASAGVLVAASVLVGLFLPARAASPVGSPAPSSDGRAAGT